MRTHRRFPLARLSLAALPSLAPTADGSDSKAACCCRLSHLCWDGAAHEEERGLGRRRSAEGGRECADKPKRAGLCVVASTSLTLLLLSASACLFVVSDDEGAVGGAALGSGGLSSVLARGHTRSALTFLPRAAGSAEEAAAGGGVSSDEDEGDGAAGDESDSELHGAGAEEARNAKEKARGPDTSELVVSSKKKKGGGVVDGSWQCVRCLFEENGPSSSKCGGCGADRSAKQRRDQEEFHAQRLKAEVGLSVDDPDEEEAQSGVQWKGHQQTPEEKERRAKAAKARAAAEAGKGASGDSKEEDTEMVDADGVDHESEEPDDPRARQARLKKIFDKSSSDKYMTFDAEDPLKPNPNKRRAAAREDDELEEEDEKDPWLKQAADDQQRKRGEAEERGEYLPDAKELKSSTDVFLGEDEAPPFDQFTARQTMLKHMKPGETVRRAVKRLGDAVHAGAAGGVGKKLQTKQKNVRTKKPDAAAAAAAGASADAAMADADTPAQLKARKAAFDELIECAQGFVSSQVAEIYEETYERIAHLVAVEQQRLAQAAARAAAPLAAATAAPAASQDARARAAARLQRKRDARAAGLPEPESSDDEDEETPRRAGAAATPAAAAAASTAASSGSSTGASSSLASPPLWVFRLTAGDDEVQGPYPSSKMADWQAAGFFDKDVLVRRHLALGEAQQPWTKVARVDFATGEISNDGESAAPANHANERPKKKFKF